MLHSFNITGVVELHYLVQCFRVGRAAYVDATHVNDVDAGAYAVTLWLKAIFIEIKTCYKLNWRKGRNTPSGTGIILWHTQSKLSAWKRLPNITFIQNKLNRLVHIWFLLRKYPILFLPGADCCNSFFMNFLIPEGGCWNDVFYLKLNSHWDTVVSKRLPSSLMQPDNTLKPSHCTILRLQTHIWSMCIVYIVTS